MDENRFRRRLQELAAPFLERIAHAAVDDMRARYDFGVALAALRDATRTQAGRHGSQLINQVARVLGIDASALRRIAHVTEVISTEEFERITQLRTPSGKTIAWSQIEILAREPSARRRRQLTLAIVREDLSVRDLVKRVIGVTHGAISR